MAQQKGVWGVIPGIFLKPICKSTHFGALEGENMFQNTLLYMKTVKNSQLRIQKAKSLFENETDGLTLHFGLWSI
jgi:hypothetical protein